MKNKLYSFSEAAEILSVTVRTIHKWYTSGNINIVKIGPPKVDILGRDRRVCRISQTEIDRLREEINCH